MLQSPPVRRALSSRLKLRHLRKVRIWGRDSDISSGIGLHVPKYTQLLAEIGLCIQPEAREVYTVRTKDLPRIIGVDDSRIKHIYERSRASVGIMVDLTAMRYYTAQIEVSGSRDEVGLAVQMIEAAIREPVTP
ncbi:putative reverse transcriptase domain-containing protein [Tanacetum coccineum]|uniref:Reverse transcriptase domain-containing protein n=1 Tax=Tanacetum coccineum TaxID=301880 RepID=A0ABQ4YNS3_9ASTR